MMVIKKSQDDNCTGGLENTWFRLEQEGRGLQKQGILAGDGGMIYGLADVFVYIERSFVIVRELGMD